jgi:nucleoside-specific outer membrane channel protein Tsx
MRRLSRIVLVAVAVSLAGTAAASAADLCILDTTYNQLWIGKSVTLPTANNCKVFIGYRQNTYETVSGTVCKTGDNQYYFFNLQFSLGYTDAGTFVFFLSSSSRTGLGTYLNWDLGNDAGFADPVNLSQTVCPSVRRFGP